MEEKNYMASKDELLADLLAEAMERNPNGKDLDKLKEMLPQGYYENQQKIKQKQNVESVEVDDFNNYDFDSYQDTNSYDVPHDLIPLPSKGLIYGPNFKSEKIAVSYLNGSDEDLISSPNLYADEYQLFNTILRRKILDKNIKPELLCAGDRDAILIWLRSTSYGEMFAIVATDEYGEQFESNVDLTKFKTKEFSLTPNSNGLFEYKLPKSGDLIEFRFLIQKDELEYGKLLQKTNDMLKKHTLTSAKDLLFEILSSDKTIEKNKKKKIDESLKVISDHIESIDDTTGVIHNKGITYRLSRSIVAINGERDRKFIDNYVNNILATDSLALRKYISENTPGLDLNIEVKKPESLGGGTINKTFQYGLDLFVNYN